MPEFENMSLWQWLKLLRIFGLLVAVAVAIAGYYRRSHPTPTQLAADEAFFAKEAQKRARAARIETIRTTQGEAQAQRAVMATVDSLLAAAGVEADSATANTATPPIGE